MRALFVAATALGLAHTARADNFVQALAGVQLPAGDSDWTDTADVSPKLQVRAGTLQHGLGGMIAFDWTPEQLTSRLTMPAGFNTGASAHRFRILVQGLVRQPVGPKLALEARGGVGLDLAHASYDYTLLGVHQQDARTDVGYALEVGGGAWWHLGSGSLEVGAELAVPIGHHDSPSQNGSVGFVYTSYDIDLLFGIRAFSR
jgi:hypothetical protein